MVQEANGNPVAVNPILVHAYDHYTMALMALDMAKNGTGNESEDC